MKINESRLKQFWDRVVEEREARTKGQTPCWLWIGSFVYIPQLYGKLSTTGATVISAVIECRDIPSKVSHRCNTNLCVNPAHLMYPLLKDKPPRFSSLTGKALQPKLHENRELIERIMLDRGINHLPKGIRQEYRSLSKLHTLARRFSIGENTLKKILLKAPMYDVLFELRELDKNKLPVQTRPHKHETSLSPVDTAAFNRNYLLPEFKNEKNKV